MEAENLLSAGTKQSLAFSKDLKETKALSNLNIDTAAPKHQFIETSNWKVTLCLDLRVKTGPCILIALLHERGLERLSF